MTAVLKVIEREGVEEYAKTLLVQKELLEEKINDTTLPEVLVLVEHEPVYTVGRSEPFQTPLDEKKDIPWVEVSRGGKATFHGPGQLVGYPIFDLNYHGKDVHVFLRKVEDALIHMLSQFGVYGFRREGLTGVWVQAHEEEPKKIASIGVGVKKWVSYHGFGLNVTTDLSYFRSISACDQSGEVMTSLEEIFSKRGEAPPEMSDVKAAVVGAFLREFSLKREDEFGVDEEEALKEPEPEQVQRKPPWLKVKAPGSPEFLETRGIVKELRLTTVCEEARCPNIGECWSHHTATFMIMGELCTRRCGFCSVKDGWMHNLEALDPLEPVRVAQAIQKLALEHVVITSVNRDDLQDMGATHFDRTVRAIHMLTPKCAIELLIPDMRGRRELVETILSSRFVKVLNHNVETVPRIYKRVRPGANLKRSLNILRWAKEVAPEVKTKSGLMLGLGEEKHEVLEVMDLLRENNCQILTLGQYLQPSKKQLGVERFVTPEEFADYKVEAQKRGFSYVESGPLVRSSYHAWKHVDEEQVVTEQEVVQTSA